MEWKIGEIKQVNGEWYQCVKSSDCPKCDLKHLHNCNHHFHCSTLTRKDGEEVIFKKLEKVEGPYADYFPSDGVIFFQRYKCYQKPVYNGDLIYRPDDSFISIEIKDKEDMEEKNLKPFDLEAAKSGKPVCTRDGRKARILCYDLKGAEYSIVAAIETRNCLAESISAYDKNGRFDHDKENNNDLMMLPEKKTGWINIYPKGYSNSTIKSLAESGLIVYPTKESAVDNALHDCIATISIEWEE